MFVSPVTVLRLKPMKMLPFLPSVHEGALEEVEVMKIGAGLTATVTSARQAFPPPKGVQVAVYVVVNTGMTVRVLPLPTSLFQVTLPLLQPV